MENISELLGKTIIKIEKHSLNCDVNDKIRFYLSDGSVYDQYHEQDCCEYVTIEDIDGDLNDLLYYPLLQAEESVSDDPNASESATWTFYKLATIKGYVTIRWYGSSNGYYSESVDMHDVTKSIDQTELNKLLRKSKINIIDENNK